MLRSILRQPLQPPAHWLKLAPAAQVVRLLQELATLSTAEAMAAITQSLRVESKAAAAAAQQGHWAAELMVAQDSQARVLAAAAAADLMVLEAEQTEEQALPPLAGPVGITQVDQGEGLAQRPPHLLLQAPMAAEAAAALLQQLVAGTTVQAALLRLFGRTD